MNYQQRTNLKNSPTAELNEKINVALCNFEPFAAFSSFPQIWGLGAMPDNHLACCSVVLPTSLGSMGADCRSGHWRVCLGGHMDEPGPDSPVCKSALGQAQPDNR